MAESMASPEPYASQCESGAGTTMSDILTTLRTTTAATRDGIVQGAVDTFQCFEQWLLADTEGQNDL